MRAAQGFAFAFLLAAQLLFASSAWATHAVPVSSTFTAVGQITITNEGVDAPCIATLVLTTDAAGNVRITQMTFTTPGSLICGSFQAERLPWPVVFTGTFGGAQTANVSSPFGSCSGTLFMSFWSSTATLSGNWGICPVSGTLSISPNFTIVTP